MLKMMRYYKPYAGQILLVFALLFVGAMADLSLPDYMSTIINNGISVGDQAVVWQTGAMMLLVSLVSAICAVLVAFLSARIAAFSAHSIRRDVFEKVEGFSGSEFDQFSTASLITRSTNDVQQLQMFTMMLLRIVFQAPIMGIGGVVRAVGKSADMTWIIALAVVVLLGIMMLFFAISLPKFKKVQKMIDRVNLIMRERLSGILVIRAFNTQEHERDRFDVANQDLTKLNLFLNRVMTLMMPVMMLIMNASSVLIVWVGSHAIDSGAMQIGDMMAFIQYAMQIIMSFLMVSMMFIFIPRASVSADRINEVLVTQPAIADPQNAQPFQKDLKGVVEFRDVSFRYPGADDEVLKQISFTANPGETTAIIGSTGSGKSTLINLIPRFYDVTGGSILVDGVDIKNVTQHDLHNKIGYVPQKGVLFSGTIASNLRYSNDNATQEEIEQAAVIAQSLDFIEEKEEKFDSPIAQSGTNVSGGQKQRLSIARALVKKPDIYIFDDSFSALDFKTDAKLRAALKPQTKNATVLIVAQRINTILGADKIIVLDEGELAGIGSHKQLMETCDVYREIALSQLSKEELA